MAIFLGNLWETPGNKGVEKIVDRPPDCFYDLVKSPGITTMHVYLKDYKTLCIFDQKMIVFSRISQKIHYLYTNGKFNYLCVLNIE